MNIEELKSKSKRLEEWAIKIKAIHNGTFMKAPNGHFSNLTEKQWVQVRTKAFKEWFGDWEKQARIEKLRNSFPIIATGNEYEGKYELTNKSAEKYIKDNLRNNYINKDTKSVIRISKRGAEKVTRHDADNKIHLQSVALIPKMLENAIFIDEIQNEKDKNGFNTFRYYVVGLKMGGKDYTAKLVIAVIGNESFYDHALTDIEKGKLLTDIDEIKRPFDNKELKTFCKDKRLFSILQNNCSKVVDKNGEPLVLYPFDKTTGEEKDTMFFSTTLETDFFDVLIPCYLNLRNPLYVDTDDKKSLKQAGEFLGADLSKLAIKDGRNGLYYHEELIVGKLCYRKSRRFDCIAYDKLQKSKYDGILFSVDTEMPYQKLISLAFYRNEIVKSTENNGNFDKNSGFFEGI